MLQAHPLVTGGKDNGAYLASYMYYTIAWMMMPWERRNTCTAAKKNSCAHALDIASYRSSYEGNISSPEPPAT